MKVFASWAAGPRDRRSLIAESEEEVWRQIDGLFATTSTSDYRYQLRAIQSDGVQVYDLAQLYREGEHVLLGEILETAEQEAPDLHRTIRRELIELAKAHVRQRLAATVKRTL